jgi:hypothetical protein
MISSIIFGDPKPMITTPRLKTTGLRRRFGGAITIYIICYNILNSSTTAVETAYGIVIVGPVRYSFQRCDRVRRVGATHSDATRDTCRHRRVHDSVQPTRCIVF